MADQELERIYTIPLRKVKAGSRNKAANRAVREVRTFLSKHMKSDDIWLDDGINETIWARGMYQVPSKIRVRAVKFVDGVVEVSLPEEEQSTSIRAQLKEERESKTPILPTVEEAAEHLAEETETDGVAEIEAEPEAEPEAKPEAPAADAEKADDKSA